MEVRTFREGDTDALIDLWRRCGLTRPWNDPEADIALARGSGTAELFVGELEGALVAGAMAGFDGHRGWLYYVAVDPDCRGRGFGRSICAHAEAWLKARGCPKVEAILRGENRATMEFYQALDYRMEDRVLMAKWLRSPPAPQDEPGPRKLAVTITFLEMTSRPRTPPKRPPVLEHPLSLLRLAEPTVPFYRYLYNTVGERWLWYERRAMSDEDISRVIKDPATEISVLYCGGSPTGYVELNARRMPGEMEIAYFGLSPEYLGRGLGPYLLDWAVHSAWDREPAPRRLVVDTCTLDHPAALQTYQRVGFTPFAQEHEVIDDPRATGLIPPETDLPPLAEQPE